MIIIAMKKILLLLLLLAITIGGGIAVFRNNKQAAAPTVATSFYPLYHFTQEIGGDRIRAINMTPVGAEPHAFEPSAKDLVDAQKSKLFVHNGTPFEPWTQKFATEFSGTIVTADKGVQIGESHEEEAHADEGNHKSESLDPHFWIDPVHAQQIVKNIRDGLIAVQPQDKDYFSERADLYIAKLASLDSDYKAALKNCSLDTVVTAHNAFNYLASRYGFAVLSISGIDPETEPSAAKLAEIADVVEQKQIPYVLFETLVSPKLADTIAKEANAKTAVFNPIEGLTEDEQKQGKNYLSVQHENINVLRSALACQ